MKKEHPILFSTPMVQAILEGRKTMTRRIIKPQPLKCQQVAIDCASPSGFSYIAEAYDDQYIKHLYGNIGDILWVRETHAITHSTGPSHKRTNWYRADNPTIPENVKFKWRPSIFMPRGVCRLLLEITDIRVERLQDISEEDARKEGVMPTKYTSTVFKSFLGYKNYYPQDAEDKGVLKTAKESFKTLWQSINGEESWNHNQWVWEISFSPTKTPQ